MDIKIDDLRISPHAKETLKNAGLLHVSHLLALKHDELTSISLTEQEMDELIKELRLRNWDE